MKIFFPLGAFYPSQIGGPCNSLYWHCKALKKNDCYPVVLTTTIGISHSVEMNKWLDLNYGRVCYLKNTQFKLSFFRVIFVEISKAEIIHLNSLFNYLSICTFLYISLFRVDKKIVWSVRGELNAEALKYGKWKKKILLLVYKFLVKDTIFHSTSLQESVSIRKVFPSNEIIEIPNLIIPSPRLNLKVEKDILFVGRIHPIKCIDNIILALSYSKVFLNSPSKFLIVGKQEPRYDSYKNKLLNLIKRLGLSDKVVFKGHIEGIEKEKIYSSSYMLILASETENFGNVVVESLNQGTPVIASKGTPWKLLEEYKAGYHVSNDPAVLSKAIDDLFSLSFMDYQNMRANSKRLVDDNFEINSQIYQWIDLYKKLTYEN